MDLDPGAPFAQPLLREGGDGGRMFVQIERLSSLAAAGLLAAVLSGCGDGGGGSPPVPPPSDPPPDVPPVPPESGVRSRGGELPEPRRPGGRVSWETVEYRRSNGLALIDASGGGTRAAPRAGPAAGASPWRCWTTGSTSRIPIWRPAGSTGRPRFGAPYCLESTGRPSRALSPRVATAPACTALPGTRTCGASRPAESAAGARGASRTRAPSTPSRPPSRPRRVWRGLTGTCRPTPRPAPISST